jgi:Xaa-Pro aminopeptidase
LISFIFKECFTRVLKGHIGLSQVVFPNGTKGLSSTFLNTSSFSLCASFSAGPLLDTLARTSLWAIGLDYLHGTGHGVGSFLNVHEGPFQARS